MNKERSDEIDSIETRFERALASAAGVNPVFPHAAKEQMRAMIEQIMRTDANLANIRGTDQGTAYKAGFAAEEWHASTFNLDSILRNDGARAYTDKYGEFKNAGYRANDTPDLVVVRNGEEILQAQVKYHKHPNDTFSALREVDSAGNIKYERMDALIVPSDQVSDIVNIASKAKHV
jgi:nucleoside 2-deoxyribosyltransferase